MVGLNRLEDSLSDWPGGRMRLARGEERVSRSEFKLEEAIATLRPWGLDVSSGVEREGVKDVSLIRAFLRRVREVEKSP